MYNPFETIENRLKRIETIIQFIQNKEAVIEAKQQQEFLTVKETAQFLKIAVSTVYIKNSKREIPGACKQNGRLYFEKQSLIEWIKQGKIKTTAEIQLETQKYFANNKKGCKNG